MKNILALIIICPIALTGQIKLNNISMRVEPGVYVSSTDEVQVTRNGYFDGGGNLVLKSDFLDNNPSTWNNAVSAYFKSNDKSVQKITSASGEAVNFSNLAVSNNSKVTCNSDLMINDGLNLHLGILEIQEGHVLDYLSYSPISNFSANHFVDGAIKREVEEDGSFLFPVGSQKNGGLYFPIEISGLQQENQFTVKFHPEGQNISSNLSSEIKKLSKTEFWQITSLNQPVGEYNVNFHWNSKTSQTKDLSDLAVASYQNEKWSALFSNSILGNSHKGIIGLKNRTTDGYFALSDFSGFNIAFIDKSYHHLKPYINEDYVMIKNHLSFSIRNLYTPNKNENLSFQIINKKNEVVLSSESEEIVYSLGHSKYVIPCIGEKITETGFYTLKATNIAGHHQFLRFYISGNTTCD